MCERLRGRKGKGEIKTNQQLRLCIKRATGTEIPAGSLVRRDDSFHTYVLWI